MNGKPTPDEFLAATAESIREGVFLDADGNALAPGMWAQFAEDKNEIWNTKRWGIVTGLWADSKGVTHVRVEPPSLSYPGHDLYQGTEQYFVTPTNRIRVIE